MKSLCPATVLAVRNALCAKSGQWPVSSTTAFSRHFASSVRVWYSPTLANNDQGGRARSQASLDGPRDATKVSVATDETPAQYRRLGDSSHSGPRSFSATLASREAPDLFSLAGRTVIVTGGGRGLGVTIAKAIIESGANVAAVDLLSAPSRDEWAVAQSSAYARGLTLTYTQLDVTDHSRVHEVFTEIFKSAPPDAPVRGMFCAAGIQMLKPALEYTPEGARKIVDVNLTGSFFCAQAFAAKYLETSQAAAQPRVDPQTGLVTGGGASIVFTGSMSGHVANYGLESCMYNASKAGVNQLAKNLAMEWGKRGIRVNVSSSRHHHEESQC